MTTTAHDLLAGFETLSPAEKHQVTVEILRRSGPDDDLSESALTGLADELFRSYDAEEAVRAKS